MKKFETVTRPYGMLFPGDLVGVSFGWLTFHSLEYLQAGYVRMKLLGEKGEVYHVTRHSSNWPEVAVDFTREYREAYPGEVFKPKPGE